ncbi:unnamed protein product, partial [Symbiodinium sp. KB8]
YPVGTMGITAPVGGSPVSKAVASMSSSPVEAYGRSMKTLAWRRCSGCCKD